MSTAGYDGPSARCPPSEVPSTCDRQMEDFSLQPMREDVRSVHERPTQLDLADPDDALACVGGRPAHVSGVLMRCSEILRRHARLSIHGRECDAWMRSRSRRLRGSCDASRGSLCAGSDRRCQKLALLQCPAQQIIVGNVTGGVSRRLPDHLRLRKIDACRVQRQKAEGAR